MVRSEVRDYKDLVVWQKSYELCVEIYKATRNFPRSELYGLVSNFGGRLSSKEVIQIWLKRILSIIIIIFVLGKLSYAYVVGSEKSNINLGATFLGISVGIEHNISNKFYLGTSLVEGGSLYGMTSSSSLYAGFYLIKNRWLFLSFLVEKLYISQNDKYEAFGAGFNVLLPEDNGREKKVDLIFYIPQSSQNISFPAILTPSAGLQVNFPIDENSKWYISDRPFLSPSAPVALFFGIILNYF